MGRTQHRFRPPGTYFITIKCEAGRQLLKGETAEILVDQVVHCRERGYYLLHEFCVMPNHIHVLFTPGAETSLEKAVQMIKGGASFRIKRLRRLHTLWQDGYHDWRCRDEKDYGKYRNYVRQNPVKSGLVSEESRWPYSSANEMYKGSLDALPQGLKAQS